jgi:hypothetical protein
MRGGGDCDSVDTASGGGGVSVESGSEWFGVIVVVVVLPVCEWDICCTARNIAETASLALRRLQHAKPSKKVSSRVWRVNASQTMVWCGGGGVEHGTVAVVVAVLYNGTSPGAQKQAAYSAFPKLGGNTC